MLGHLHRLSKFCWLIKILFLVIAGYTFFIFYKAKIGYKFTALGSYFYQKRGGKLYKNRV